MKRQPLKKLGALLPAIALAGCIQSDDNEASSVEVTGSLPTDQAGLESLGSLTQAGPQVGNESQQLLSNTLDSSSNSAPRARSLAPQPRAIIGEPQSCGNQQGTLSVDLTNQALSFIFADCAGETGTINGSIGFAINGTFEEFVNNISNDVFNLALTVNYGQLSVESNSAYVYLNGSVTTNWVISNESWQYNVDSSSLTYRDSIEHDFTLNDFDFDMQGSVHQGEGSLNTQWTYDYLITNSDGTFHVTSTGPILLEDGVSEKRNGQIVIEGVNATLTIDLDADAVNTTEEVMFRLAFKDEGLDDVTGSTSQATFYGWN